jgi:hypothetical protein
MQSLGKTEAEVDAQIVVRGARCRQREQRGDRARLREPGHAVVVDRPFRVLRRSVLRSNARSKSHERANLIVRDAVSVVSGVAHDMRGPASGL